MKNARQQKILEIIEKCEINTQEALIEKLKECGFFATQTTVSRDINALKLVKVISSNGSYRYTVSTPNVSGGNVIGSSISDAIIAVEAARNIVVVKTYAGMANAVAVSVDALARDEIVGSVAGDDTILIVVRTDETAHALAHKLSSVFGI